MTRWLRRIRGAVGMGLTWALVWAPVAVLIGTRIVDPDNSMDEMWVMIGAIPGFLSGVAFSALLGVAAHRRRLDELSVARAGGWGALAGLAIGTLPFLIGEPAADGPPVWLLGAVVVSSITLLSAASAAGSLALAQRAHRRQAALAGGAGADDAGLAGGARHAPLAPAEPPDAAAAPRAAVAPELARSSAPRR